VFCVAPQQPESYNALTMSDYDDTSHHQGVLLEEMSDDIKRLAEAMAGVPADVHQLKDDVSQLKTDVAVIKAVVTDQSSQLNNHEIRITKLEHTAI
jgi:archaellum component FlaC